MRAKDLVALFALAAVWGSSYLFIRVAVPALGPLVVSTARVVVASIGLIGFALVAKRRSELPCLTKPFLVLGILNAAVPYAMIALAELHLTASLAGILNATTPLFTAVVAAGVLKERLSPTKLLGLGFGFTGVGVLVGWNPAPFDSWLVISVVAMLLASLSYGFATVYAKQKLKNVSSFGAACGQQFGGAVVLLPLGIISVANGSSDTTPSIRVALAMLALGLLCTSVAYLLYFHLIASAGATNTSSVGFLIPIFGILWSVIFLDEAVHSEMLVGLAFILASVGLVTGIRIPGRPAFKVPESDPGVDRVVETCT